MADDMLLRVRDLSVTFRSFRGLLGNVVEEKAAVRAVSLDLAAGETLGLVGESGSGKSTTARAILNLLPRDPRVRISGTVEFQGTRISGLSDAAMRPFRRHLQVVFQDPFASLDPRMTLGDLVGEPLVIFGTHSPRARKLKVLELLDLVGLDPRYLNRYPHEFSGGQRQRIGIARALALQPRLIVCDEPVSALDVSIQAQIINLLRDLQREFGLAYLFIAHDLAVVRQIASRVAVMKEGEIVETGSVAEVYAKPSHAYTRALLAAVPEMPGPASRA